MKNRKNLFLTLIVMLTTLCISGADVVKDKLNMDNENKEPEEILPIEIDEHNSESLPPIMAGKVLPPKDGEKIESYKDDDITPLAGEVVPVEPYRDTPETHAAGDIPPSWAVEPPQKKSISVFFKSLIDKLGRYKYRNKY